MSEAVETTYNIDLLVKQGGRKSIILSPEYVDDVPTIKVIAEGYEPDKTGVLSLAQTLHAAAEALAAHLGVEFDTKVETVEHIPTTITPEDRAPRFNPQPVGQAGFVPTHLKGGER